MSTKKDELLTTLECTENQTNLVSGELIKKEEIKNSPFELITTEKERFIVLGKYKLQISDKVGKTIEEAEAWLWENFWNVLLEVSYIINQEK